ncbi:MAG: orotidine-5'-phosphate decarboxylase [Oceanicaulis sp.]
MTFAARIAERCARLGHLCVGLDPSYESLGAWGLPHTAKGAEIFSRTMIELCADHAAAFKPQSAHFERFGADGLAALDRVVGAAQEAGCPVILDAKRGDIGPTSASYAEAFTRPGATPDAVTLTAYLGFGALRPLFDRFARAGIAPIVVVRSSNPEGARVQTARLEDGRTVAESLCDDIAAWNARTGEARIGAVIGATLGAEAGRLAERLCGAPILAPGLGAQGATPQDVAQAFGGAARFVLASASRDIARLGRDRLALKEEAMRLQSALRFS